MPHSDLTPLPAYILCGGRSQRFGADKARVLIEGIPQLLRLCGTLQRAGHEVRCVADRADRYRDLGVECLVDSQPDCGPMAGLECALRHRTAEIASHVSLTRGGEFNAIDAARLLVVSCDQAIWWSSWSEELCEAIKSKSNLQVAAYFDNAWQPLPMLVDVSLLADVQRRLQSGRLSLQGMLLDRDEEGQCGKVCSAVTPRSWSFNTPEELAKLPKP